jgi:diadenosine tetraphosphate (Ap4A) HIT family hydrolase
MTYDSNNIFAKILRGEIPCKKIDEDEHTLSFADINPQAPVHILVIPKGAYCDWADFAATASAVEMAAFTKAIHRVAELTGISKTGYRVISNTGLDSHQEVPHLHMHVLGGAPVGPLVFGKTPALGDG